MTVKRVRKRNFFFYWFVIGKLEDFFFFYIKGVLALRNHCVLKILVLGLRVIL